MIKFIGGPALGPALGLTYWETVLFTISGMMTTVVLVSFFGIQLRHFLLRKKIIGKKKFSRRSRRFVYIWKRYGLLGVSFLTPVIFSPVVGTLLASVLGAPRLQLMVYMLVSAAFWGLGLSFVLHQVM
ncbi:MULTISPECIES: hypothetical protein [Persicobacter]|nr:hypothetical protein [Persicobacter sp. CCB-QB2]